MAGQTSPFWTKLACEDEGRKGAPCPVPSNQGALTPTFLALAPGIQDKSGEYFEWCANFTIDKCLDNLHDMMHLTCAMTNHTEQDQLWNLTVTWLGDWTAPIAPALVTPLAEAPTA